MAPGAPRALFVRDAHDLYLETLAELGAVGLALLLVARSHRSAERAAGRWRACRSGGTRRTRRTSRPRGARLGLELPAVTLCTIVLGVGLIRLAGSAVSPQESEPARAALATAGLLMGAIAVTAHVGNGRRQRPGTLRPRRPRDSGARGRAARRFASWAAEPWRLRGEAELAEASPLRGGIYAAQSETTLLVGRMVDLALVTRGGAHEQRSPAPGF